jgi:chromosome segregation ATPase
MADPADPERKTTPRAGRLPRRRTGAPREQPQGETRGPLAKMRLPRREAKRGGADVEAEVEKASRTIAALEDDVRALKLEVERLKVREEVLVARAEAAASVAAAAAAAAVAQPVADLARRLGTLEARLPDRRGPPPPDQ